MHAHVISLLIFIHCYVCCIFHSFKNTCDCTRIQTNSTTSCMRAHMQLLKLQTHAHTIFFFTFLRIYDEWSKAPALPIMIPSYV